MSELEDTDMPTPLFVVLLILLLAIIGLTWLGWNMPAADKTSKASCTAFVNSFGGGWCACNEVEQQCTARVADTFFKLECTVDGCRNLDMHSAR